MSCGAARGALRGARQRDRRPGGGGRTSPTPIPSRSSPMRCPMPRSSSTAPGRARPRAGRRRRRGEVDAGMYETNVMGVMRVTKALLPALEREGTATSSSSAQSPESRSIPAVAATPPRSTPRARHANPPPRAARQADPGDGDRPGAGRDRVLAGPIRGRRGPGGQARGNHLTDRRGCRRRDRHVVTRPPHVDVDYLSIKPTEQATAWDVHRRG